MARSTCASESDSDVSGELDHDRFEIFNRDRRFGSCGKNLCLGISRRTTLLVGASCVGGKKNKMQDQRNSISFAGMAEGGILLRPSDPTPSKSTKCGYLHEVKGLSRMPIRSCRAAQGCPVLSRNRHQIDTKNPLFGAANIELASPSRCVGRDSIYHIRVSIASKDSPENLYANFRIAARLRLVLL
jgi:hypothetical protein